MSRQTRWNWLGEPLAHDFANTIHWRASTPIDHIADLQGLRSWLDHEPQPLPVVPTLTEELAASVRRLRDAVREAMLALAEGREPDGHAVQAINDAARDNPMTHVLEPDGRGETLEPVGAGAHPLLGVLAQAAVTTIGNPDQRARIAFCAAPGCGGLFERDRPNQVWCDPHCGARARADRHHQASA